MRGHIAYEHRSQDIALDSSSPIKPYTRGAISTFYNVFQNVNGTSSAPFKEAEGRELKSEILDEIWEK